VQENPLQSDANNEASSIVRSTVGKFLSAQLNQLSSNVVSGVEFNFDSFKHGPTDGNVLYYDYNDREILLKKDEIE
jgi:hypothetical protein